MKAVVQRVACARVRVAGEVVGECGPGLLVLLGVLRGDRLAEAERLAHKVAHFRMFPDAEPGRQGEIGHGRMNASALERGFGALVVSQVTLAADGRKGRRPSLDAAAEPAQAEALYRDFCRVLGDLGLAVARGRFGAAMEVELVNHGPVTFLLAEDPPQVLA